MSRRAMVIKAGTDTRGDREARPFFVNDIMAEIEAAAADRKARAAEAIEQAHAEAAAIRRQADEQGHADGYQRGLEEGRQAGREEALAQAKKEFAARHAKLVDTFHAVIASVDAERVGARAAAKKDGVELAMAIARRVVKHVSRRDRQVVLANIDEAAELVGARSDVTLLVNPKDVETAADFVEGFDDMRQRWQHVRILADENVSPGGCRVEWRGGAVDATLETQLERIATALDVNPGDHGGGGKDDMQEEPGGTEHA